MMQSTSGHPPLNIFTNVILFVLPLATLLKVPYSRSRNTYIALLYCVGIFSVASTTVRLVLYIKDPNDGLNQAIWGGIEGLTVACIVVAPTLCSLFSIAADKTFDEESRAMQNDSTDNIIDPISNDRAVPHSNNIIARCYRNTTSWKMCRGQRRRARRLHDLSAGRGMSIQMSNFSRPRARSVNFEDAFELPEPPGGLGNYATAHGNFGPFALEGTRGILRTEEVDVTREDWTEEDREALQSRQTSKSSLQTRTTEEAAIGTRTFGDYFASGSEKWAVL
ncbi:hypothetical protein MMC18_003566 [Xylographa bjoerkii]|nr:hypothetical protein [Xylographa bjoerkii]